jgi:hypothetical protein
MPNDTNEQDRHQAPSTETEDRAPRRRNVLLGSSALAAAMTSGALAQAMMDKNVGIGSYYLWTYKDAAGGFPDGAVNYRLRIAVIKKCLVKRGLFNP